MDDMFLLQNGCVSINRILALATHMVDTNHYAAQHIRILAGRINQAWKELTCALDERNTLLALSVSFHQKAEQVFANETINYDYFIDF